MAAPNTATRSLAISNQNYQQSQYHLLQGNNQSARWTLEVIHPSSIIQPAIKWYHLVLGHPGSQRLYDTIHSRFYHPGLWVLCQQYQCPNNCIMYKNNGRPYGHLVPKQALLALLTECAVDLIGPWKISIYGWSIVFKALTAINPVTNLLEIIQINDKSSTHVAQHFSNCWLSRYPWRTRVVHDNEEEFIGWEFQGLLTQLGIRSVPTIVKNPNPTW